MNLILIAIIFISGWLLGLATFLAGSLWRGGVGSSLQTEIAGLLNGATGAGRATAGTPSGSATDASPIPAAG